MFFPCRRDAAGGWPEGPLEREMAQSVTGPLTWLVVQIRPTCPSHTHGWRMVQYG